MEDQETPITFEKKVVEICKFLEECRPYTLLPDPAIPKIQAEK